MSCYSLLLLLLLFFLPLLVVSDTCNDQIHFNGREQKSSVYCSSCSTYIEGQYSSSFVQIELPSLMQLTGIFVQYANGNDENKKKINSYFLEYRRTQDGPWLIYGRRHQQRKLLIERRRLHFDIDVDPNKTRTFLPSIIARQIRLIFITSSMMSTCTIIQLFGCQSQNGLISTRFSQDSIINTDLKYDGLITNTTARGGLGLLTDGDTYQFLQWSSSPEPILLLFAFDSIKQFQSIHLDMKCSISCTIKINVGVLEIIRDTNLWTNHFHSVQIHQTDQKQNTTITHLVLALAKLNGQFVVIQIHTNQQIAISEVTFHHQNEFHIDENQDILPSAIYIETNLHRLEILAKKSLSDDHTIYDKLLNLLIFILIICALLMIFLLISCLFTQQVNDEFEKISDEMEPSLTTITTSNDDDDHHEKKIYSSQSQLDLYSNLDETTSIYFEPVQSEKIINETSQATIRRLTPNRQSLTSHYLISTNHLIEIDSNEIIILENLGAKTNHQCFLSEYGEKKLSVILYEQETNEFFNLSKLINHSNIVSCLGFVHVSPERRLLVSEYSQINLYDYCRILNNKDENLRTILMSYLNDIVSALVHLETINLIIRDLTLPNCLLFDEKFIKISDHAKYDDRYLSRYVQQMPIRWLPGDIVTGDENWSIQTTIFMFGSLIYELFHLGTSIPYQNLTNNEVFEFYRHLWLNSKTNGIEPSVLCFSTYFTRPNLCNDRLYALIERCLSWSSFDRPSFREISLCLNETTTTTTTTADTLSQ